MNKTSKILIIGDLLLDYYKFYESIRSDPANTHAPVISLLQERVVPGGAGNLTRNIRSLTNACVKFSHAVENQNIPKKIRYYINDIFSFREDENDKIKYNNIIPKSFSKQIQKDDIVIISDYHKGTLTYDDVANIIAKCKKEGAISLVDTNFVKQKHYEVDYLKINLKTTNQYLGQWKSMWLPREKATLISNNLKCNTILTLSEDGFVYYDRDGDFIYDKTYPAPVESFIDSIGAGDSFLAGFASYMIEGKSVKESLNFASITSHISVCRCGTLDSINREEADEKYNFFVNNV